MRALAVIVSLVLALALAACGGDDGGGEPAADTATETAPAQQAAGDGACREVEAPEPKRDGGQREPRAKLEEDVSHEAIVKTNCGDFTIAIDSEGAPNTAASFVSLARDGFFDGTVFHRIVPGFVIQGGDPTGTGTGGPGYSTRDEPPRDARYTKGVVAMAKTAAEPAGTAGSQFFVVVGEDVGLPPDYAILGRVTEGLDVVERIGQMGDPASEQPTQTVEIESVDVRER